MSDISDTEKLDASERIRIGLDFLNMFVDKKGKLNVTKMREKLEQYEARIAELEAENQRARDEVTRLEGIIARWGEHTQMYEARIAELEAACEKAEYELDWHSDELRKLEAEEQLFNKTFDAQQVIIEELRAENWRLRDALNAISHDAEDTEIVRMAVNALLGGGENG